MCASPAATGGGIVGRITVGCDRAVTPTCLSACWATHFAARPSQHRSGCVIGEQMHYFADAPFTTKKFTKSTVPVKKHESSSTLPATGRYVTPIIGGVVEHPPGEDMAAIAQLTSDRTLPSAGRSPSRLVEAILRRLRHLPDTAAHVAEGGQLRRRRQPVEILPNSLPPKRTGVAHSETTVARKGTIMNSTMVLVLTTDTLGRALLVDVGWPARDERLVTVAEANAFRIGGPTPT